MPNPLIGPLLRFASGLRFPTLFWITAGLFAVNLVVPDAVPFADELLLGLLALLFASLKRRGAARPPTS
jgi:hypothetical protein